MNRILPILFCVVGAIDSAAGSTAGISNLATLGANDSADWSQLGPAFTAVSSNFTATSLSGLTLTGSGTALERRDEGYGWIGVFNPDDVLLWNGDSGTPITINFSSPVRGVGAQIQGDFIGMFTVTITAYQGTTVLGSFSVSGNAQLAEDGSAPFLGILSSSPNITRVVISETDSSVVNAFALNRLYITTASAPPVIISRFPAAGATGITYSEVDVTFDRAMNAATLNSSTFTLRAAGASSDVAASIYVSGASASLIPSSALAAGTAYTATLAATVAGTDGIALGTAATWTFTTAGSSGSPPVIVGRFPAAGATGVTSSEVDVTFNRTMNAATLNPSTFTLRAAGAGSNVAASIYVSGAAASLIPSSALAAGTTYTATLAATVADTNGNALGTPATWTFTTAGSSGSPPVIVGRFPAAGATGVTSSEVDVTFDRTMNAATLNSASFTLRAAGAGSNVPASIYVSGAAASLIPSSALAAGTTYTATLAATVADTNGNSLGTAATWTFTTAGSSGSPPVIVSRFPAAGATGVSRAGEVDVTFDRAMNAATLNSSTFTLRAAGASSDVAATIYVSSAAASLVPSSALAASTTYTVTLAATVADTNGIALGTAATWSFTTGTN